VTGLGWRRQREIVQHYAMNDRRVLPPSGIPLGNLQAGFAWLDLYQHELGALSFPPDGAKDAPYPIYDRWGDSFNVQTEFVIVNQARSLATAAFLMAQTPLKSQPWRALPAQIELRNPPAPLRDGPARIDGPAWTASLKVDGLELQNARIVWEARDHEPAFGSTFTFAPSTAGPPWVEAEVQCLDGRRFFAVTNLPAAAALGTAAHRAAAK
jgi:hypothetical protein